MDFNSTLIIQMLVFAAFVMFTMKFVWPPISKALEERQDKIADGLAAAERGRKELELAQHRVKSDLKQAKADAASILEKANKRAAQIVEEAKEAAKQEASLQIKMGQEQLAKEINHAKEALRSSQIWRGSMFHPAGFSNSRRRTVATPKPPISFTYFTAPVAAIAPPGRYVTRPASGCGPGSTFSTANDSRTFGGIETVVSF